MILFEFLSERGRGCITEWVRKLGVRAKARMNNRVSDLKRHGVGSEETLNYCPHERDGIYRLKVKHKPQLRPLLCKGPIQMEGEATFLLPVIEENDKHDPPLPDALRTAAKRRKIIERDHSRRVEYGTDI